jgi:hypothetical protein
VPGSESFTQLDDQLWILHSVGWSVSYMLLASLVYLVLLRCSMYLFISSNPASVMFIWLHLCFYVLFAPWIQTALRWNKQILEVSRCLYESLLHIFDELTSRLDVSYINFFENMIVHVSLSVPWDLYSYGCLVKIYYVLLAANIFIHCPSLNEPWMPWCMQDIYLFTKFKSISAHTGLLL